MKDRTVILIFAASLLCLVCFIMFAVIPIKNNVNDGGSVMYSPVTGIYEVWKLHRTVGENGGYTVGTAVKLFGIEIYNNSTVVYE